MVPAFEMRTVVTGKHDQCVLSQTKLFDFVHHLANRLVQIGDHPGNGRFGMLFCPVMPIRRRRFIKLANEFLAIRIRYLQVRMRLLQTHVQKELRILVLTDPLQ